METSVTYLPISHSESVLKSSECNFRLHFSQHFTRDHGNVNSIDEGVSNHAKEKTD